MVVPDGVGAGLKRRLVTKCPYRVRLRVRVAVMAVLLGPDFVCIHVLKAMLMFICVNLIRLPVLTSVLRPGIMQFLMPPLYVMMFYFLFCRVVLRTRGMLLVVINLNFLGLRRVSVRDVPIVVRRAKAFRGFRQNSPCVST